MEAARTLYARDLAIAPLVAMRCTLLGRMSTSAPRGGGGGVVISFHQGLAARGWGGGVQIVRAALKGGGRSAVIGCMLAGGGNVTHAMQPVGNNTPRDPLYSAPGLGPALWKLYVRVQTIDCSAGTATLCMGPVYWIAIQAWTLSLEEFCCRA